jgi:hypothetical protein
MKTRTMVYLDPRELQALRAEAKATGISLAELVRRLVRRHLHARETSDPIPKSAYLKIVALGSSGRKDIARRHDVYIAEALRRQHAR